MQKYIVPQTEVAQLHSQVIMDSINIVHHSGGSNGDNSGGFGENDVF